MSAITWAVATGGHGESNHYVITYYHKNLIIDGHSTAVTLRVIRDNTPILTLPVHAEAGTCIFRQNKATSIA